MFNINLRVDHPIVVHIYPEAGSDAVKAAIADVKKDLRDVIDSFNAATKLAEDLDRSNKALGTEVTEAQKETDR